MQMKQTGEVEGETGWHAENREICNEPSHGDSRRQLVSGDVALPQFAPGAQGVEPLTEAAPERRRSRDISRAIFRMRPAAEAAGEEARVHGDFTQRVLRWARIP